MDLLAGIQGGHKGPELIARRNRKAMIALAHDILDLDSGGKLEVDPILVMICREFAACPRVDWAEKIQAFYELHRVRIGELEEARETDPATVAETGIPSPFKKADEDEAEISDAQAALDGFLNPVEINFDLNPGAYVEFWWDSTLDIRWRWDSIWRRVYRCVIQNRLVERWGTRGSKWNVKRVDLDHFGANAAWRAEPVFEGAHCTLTIRSRGVLREGV